MPLQVEKAVNLILTEISGIFNVNNKSTNFLEAIKDGDPVCYVAIAP